MKFSKLIVLAGLVTILLGVVGQANASCIDKSTAPADWRYEQLDH